MRCPNDLLRRVRRAWQWREERRRRLLRREPARPGPALGAPPGVRRPARFAALSLALAGEPGRTAAAAPPAKPLGCLIEPDRVADVGSQVVGLVERLSVERGERVSAGQPLVSLRADVERANAGVAAVARRQSTPTCARRRPASSWRSRR